MRRRALLLPALAVAGGEFTTTSTSAPSVAIGSTVTLTVSFTNTGTADLTDPSLIASYRTGVAALESASVTGGGCTGEVTCALPRFAPGERVDVVIVLGRSRTERSRSTSRAAPATRPRPGCPAIARTRRTPRSP